MSGLFTETRSSVFWLLRRALGSQGVQFVASIVIARLLAPEDFGLVAAAMIAIQFARRLGEFGFSTILIQKKEITNDHIKTAYTLSLLLNATICALVFFAAGPVAAFLGNADVAPLLKAFSSLFLMSGLVFTPLALLKRDMRFKEISLISFIENLFNFAAPIVFALLGMGVWSLVLGRVLGALSEVVLVHWKARWLPQFGITRAGFREVFNFGVWLNLQSYLLFIAKNIDYFAIGKFIGTAQLGFYERAFKLLHAPRKRLSQMMQSVLFAAYAKIQDDDRRLFAALNKVILATSLLTFPLFTASYIIAPSLIPVMYGAKWLAVVAPFQIICLQGITETLIKVFDPIFLARGAIRWRAYLLVSQAVIQAVLVFLALPWGIVGVAWAMALASLLFLAITLLVMQRKMHYSLATFFRNTWIAAKYSLVVALAMLGMRALIAPYLAMDSIITTLLLATAAFAGGLIAHWLWRNQHVIAIVDEIFGDHLRKYNTVRFVRLTCRALHLPATK